LKNKILLFVILFAILIAVFALLYFGRARKKVIVNNANRSSEIIALLKTS